MEQAVRQLFERYAGFFARSLAGEPDPEEAAALYAPEFIAATPAGIATGKNDAEFLKAMRAGYEYYRSIGTREMRIRHLHVACIDDWHCLAHVAWTAVYARDDLPETEIDFEVHYLVQVLNGEPKVFGWMSGDEQALLKARGVV
ncbi:nuclear transport factor 2 family protein [Rhodobacter sp. SGA-6-6]|uniref:nuclear transport factor 2 family protein n=1 Tax=Rhodobacter sp. SGA-6-6 TaxID=2710882 RepID=UPI0013ECD825|nr:nuclear transport factor 2 family protein [Rhodobacter sp. SGA-6-6]NGM44666.1 nuclear transport factor 2 family protein [Rhodobacter sp. SGA-6-6]